MTNSRPLIKQLTREHVGSANYEGTYRGARGGRSAAVLSGFLLAAFSPVSFAADVPKTKAECEKTKDMKWDETTKTCVKK